MKAVGLGIVSRRFKKKFLKNDVKTPLKKTARIAHMAKTDLAREQYG